jgi:NAD(P)-dependent dehydrogenase (short-subunit alcohol dehydrogenase family)
MGQLAGKVAIVTGGGTGIGKGIARAFAAEGCSVVIAARNAARLDAAARELAATGSAIVAVPTDVTDEVQVKNLFKKAIDRFGRLDILVNNSGAFDGGRIDKVSTEAWKRVMDVNVTGPFLCTREAFAIMKEAGGGRIINIGSISAQRAREHSAPYTTSKNAIWGLTQCTALDGREFGIAASCLHPGNTMVERRADGRSATGRDMGAEPMVSVEDMARTALLMATLPPETNMLEAIVLPIAQPYIGRG